MNKNNISEEHQIDENEILRYWKVINPHGMTHAFQVFKIDGSTIQPISISNIDELVQLCHNYNLKGLSCVSLNPVKDSTVKTEDIAQIRNILFDIDVRSERKNNGISTEVDKGVALEIANKIIENLMEFNLKPSLLIDSGNGFHIYVSVAINPPPFNGKDENENRIIWEQSEIRSRLIYLESCYKKYNNSIIEIDCISKDIARRVKIPGTWNVKADIQPQDYRIARIIKEYTENITDTVLNDNTAAFNSIVIAEKLETTPIEQDENQDFEELKKKDKKLNDLLNGNWEKYGGGQKKWTRSEAEYALLCKLIWYEFTKENIYSVMDTCKIGKWQEEDTGYKEHQYGSAVGWVNENGGTKSQVHKVVLADVGSHLINKNIETSILPQVIGARGAIPVEITYTCSSEECGYVDVKEVKPESFLAGKMSLNRDCPACDGSMYGRYTSYQNCYPIQAISPFANIMLDQKKNGEDQGKKIEEFRMVKPLPIFYITDSLETIPFSVLKIKGRVGVNTDKKPFRFFIICDDIQPEEDFFLNYKITEQDHEEFRKYFVNNQCLDSDIDDTIAPQITGRSLMKSFMALTQHSVLYIKDNTPGILSVLLVGDSRCGKTVLLIDITYHLSPIGCEYVTAETASRTGVSYTLKQINDSWEVEWGILPLCDKMLVSVDGLHAWSEEEMMQLREVMSQGVIRVRRVVKADAPARVRRIGSLNLRDKVATYPTRWHATMASHILGHVDRNRWDAIFVFGENDINKAEINQRHRLWKEGAIQRKIPADVWRKHVIWVWQLTPNRIIITDGTYKKIEAIVNEIHQGFQGSIVKPFTNEFFNIFEKMTVAYACLNHSVDEHDNLIVKPEHADAIKEKFEEYMEHLELEKVKLTEDIVPLDELVSLLSQLKGTNKEKILLFIGNRQGCRQIDIKDSLGMDPGNLSTTMKWFQENQLITDRRKLKLSEIGAELYRKLLVVLQEEKRDGHEKVVTRKTTTLDEDFSKEDKVVATNHTTKDETDAKNDVSGSISIKENDADDISVAGKVATTFYELPLNEKINEVRNFVIFEKEAQRKVSYDSLTGRFPTSFIDECIERHILIKLPNESYDLGG